MTKAIETEDMIQSVKEEIGRNMSQFGDFNSSHEIYAVLLEEVEEFWDSVKNDKYKADYRELIQVAAVAIHGAIQLKSTQTFLDD